MTTPRIDEAFLPLHGLVERMLAFKGEFQDDDAGVRSYITACEIEAPIELDVIRDVDGAIRIGSTPPLYNVRTSILPSVHQLRFRAVRDEAKDV